MIHVDLFSGIGGFALAARWVGWRTVQFVEIDPYRQSVLRHHWPEVPIHDDINTFDPNGRRCGIVSAGFPCQPFSSASRGRARGKADDRYLWPRVRELLGQLQSPWVCLENVPHLDRLALADVVSDLEALGYEIGILEIPACAVGFDHRRSRLWILGYANGYCQSGMQVDAEVAWMPRRESEPRRVAASNGVSAQLAAIGESIVPQIAYELFLAIEANR